MIKKEHFLYPVRSLKGKHNFKLNHRINETGSITTIQASLHCDTKEKREEIILKHFLLHLKNNEDCLLDIVDRDNPWDFLIIKDKKYAFIVEITSFSENEVSFIKKKREEKYQKLSKENTLRLRDLRKLAKEFSLAEHIDLLLDQSKELHGDTIIENPLPKWSHVILSMTNTDDEKLSFLELVELAIQSKLNKSEKTHPNKESVYLVLDNRTTKYNKENYDKALKKLSKKSKGWPFLGIYIYTGFYSDDDGKNAEFYISKIN